MLHDLEFMEATSFAIYVACGLLLTWIGTVVNVRRDRHDSR